VKPPPLRAQRFSRDQRLTRPSEFGRVMAEASRSADRYFTVLSRAGSRGASRLGLAVAKKAARRAVDRNRIKRLAREAFRRCAASESLDFVVFARPPAASQPAAVLRASLERHLVQLYARQSS